MSGGHGGWDAGPEVEKALAILGERARPDVPLAPLTTYGVGGRAAVLVRAENLDDLKLTGHALAESGLPVLVLGRGSNLLVADRGFGGVVVVLSGDAFSSIQFLQGNVVRAGGAVLLPVLARQTASYGLTGLEWAVGVPGSVGGALRMNAGGHGADTSQTLCGCRWVDLRSGQVVDLARDELAFGYRRSAVEAHHVVVSADYQLAVGDAALLQGTIREIVRWRREHQPGGQNAGSVFTNPPGDPPADSAGWLVEAAGLKGYRRGTAMVSEKHANFIQADPGGSADDVVALMRDVQQQVASRLGVTLRAEVKLIGFDPAMISGLSGEPGR